MSVQIERLVGLLEQDIDNNMCEWIRGQRVKMNFVQGYMSKPPDKEEQWNQWMDEWR